MKVTQGILKYCKIYGVTFDNKYSEIKSIVTTEDYSSKFLSNNSGKVSQTSTILSSNNMYYNTVEESTLINCNVENGRFIKSTLLGLASGTNYINDGLFSGCTLRGYTINGGKFYNCVIDNSNTWNFGHWHNSYGSTDFTSKWYSGVWNSGAFTGEWFGGTFNDGQFNFPGVWYDGIANGGTFSGITWYNGLARNANFVSQSTFEDGIFNDGYFVDSTFHGGNFNGGKMINSIISGGTNIATIYNGSISGCTVDGNTEIKGGSFKNVTIDNGDIFNIDASYLSVNGGNFYSGNYSNTLFNGGNIHNGMYINITGATLNLTIHNGAFKNSIFDSIFVENGNFTNCLSTGLTWLDGIYTDGIMWNCVWYDGYWNDGLFYAGDCYTPETSNVIVIGYVNCGLQGDPIICGTSVTITITNAGAGISSLLDIYSGTTLGNLSKYIEDVSKSALLAGYPFTADPNALIYRVMDKSCLTSLDLYCTPPTTTTTTSTTTTTTTTPAPGTTTTTTPAPGTTTTTTPAPGTTTSTTTTTTTTEPSTTTTTTTEEQTTTTTTTTTSTTTTTTTTLAMWYYQVEVRDCPACDNAATIFFNTTTVYVVGKFYKWGTTPGHRSAEIISKNGSGTSGSDGITSMTQYNNCSSTCLAP